MSEKKNVPTTVQEIHIPSPLWDELVRRAQHDKTSTDVELSVILHWWFEHYDENDQVHTKKFPF